MSSATHLPALLTPARPDPEAALPGARALDGLNLFIANIQTAFGPFVAVYLAGQKWTQVDIGLALSIGTVATMLSQLPAGAMVDAVRDKRRAAAVGLVAVAVAALLTALWPARLAIAIAQVLHGFASCIIGPALAAISLAMVGHAALGPRLGRNARYGAIGNGAAALLMGLAGSLISERAVFLLAIAFTLPALGCLPFIPRLHAATNPAAGTDAPAPSVPARRPLWRVFATPALASFAASVFLFHLANAALLPIASVQLTRAAGSWGSALVAACIVVPQMVVAAMSPAVGAWAERHGRRLVLIIGFAALPLRALLFALLPPAPLLVAFQALDGISAASFGVLVPLVAADLTRGTGRYNLLQGALGLVAAAGATLSTALAGLVADRLGTSAAFTLLALAGLASVLTIALTMPETRDIQLAEA